jgi:hypothetical protein
VARSRRKAERRSEKRFERRKKWKSDRRSEWERERECGEQVRGQDCPRTIIITLC